MRYTLLLFTLFLASFSLHAQIDVKLLIGEWHMVGYDDEGSDRGIAYLKRK